MVKEASIRLEEMMLSLQQVVLGAANLLDVLVETHPRTPNPNPSHDVMRSLVRLLRDLASLLDVSLREQSINLPDEPGPPPVLVTLEPHELHPKLLQVLETLVRLSEALSQVEGQVALYIRPGAFVQNPAQRQVLSFALQTFIQQLQHLHDLLQPTPRSTE